MSKKKIEPTPPQDQESSTQAAGATLPQSSTAAADSSARKTRLKDAQKRSKQRAKNGR